MHWPTQKVWEKVKLPKKIIEASPNYVDDRIEAITNKSKQISSVNSKINFL